MDQLLLQIECVTSASLKHAQGSVPPLLLSPWREKGLLKVCPPGTLRESHPLVIRIATSICSTFLYSKAWKHLDNPWIDIL